MTIQEPISTYSSAAFLLAAAFVWLTSPSIPTITSFSLLGIASIGFHASGSARNTFWHRLDELSIYVLLVVLLYHAFNEPLWLLGLGMAAVLLIIPHLGAINLFRIVPVVGLLIAVGIAYTTGRWQAALTVVAALVAGYVRLRLPDTDAWHGLWHVLAAATALLAWWVTG